MANAGKATWITAEQVAWIRYLHDDKGMGYKLIAESTGLSWNIVRDVLRGKSWKKVA